MATLQEAVVTQTVTREQKRIVMRLKISTAPKIKEGETRIKSGFLFLPKEIKDEWRWLEEARWKETVIKTGNSNICNSDAYILIWAATQWL